MGPDNKFMWQWIKLETGQTLLIKRRKNIARISEKNIWIKASYSKDKKVNNDDHNSVNKNKKYNVPRRNKVTSHIESDTSYSLDLQSALNYVKKNIDDDHAVGASLRRVIEKGSTGQVSAFITILVDYISNIEKNSNKKKRSSRVSYPRHRHEDTQIVADRGGLD